MRMRAGRVFSRDDVDSVNKRTHPIYTCYTNAFEKYALAYTKIVYKYPSLCDGKARVFTGRILLCAMDQMEEVNFGLL